MGENDLRVVVEQPTDWISSVAIPVAAILVSSLIAVWVASAERRAADRAHIRQTALSVMRELGRMTAAAKQEDVVAMNVALDALLIEVNALSALLPARKQVVPKFLALVTVESTRSNDPGHIGQTAAWLATAVENWTRGVMPEREFRRSMPPDERGVWMNAVDLSQWRKVVSGEITL